jgi:hypothetical protein
VSDVRCDYVVQVSDTGSVGELERAAQTAQASLTADVLACPDGGTNDGGPTEGLCLSNPSFEGTPTAQFDTDIGAPPWTGCVETPFNSSGLVAGNTTSVLGDFPPATDGQTYLSLDAVAVFNSAGSVSEALCAPMHAGTTYSLDVDLFSVENLGGQSPAFLQILGSTGACSPAKVFWSSPLAGPTWHTYCATFTPTEDTTYLALSAGEADAGPAGELLVDHLVPVSSCP